mgnify:CR=1 FL=1
MSNTSHERRPMNRDARAETQSSVTSKLVGPARDLHPPRYFPYDVPDGTFGRRTWEVGAVQTSSPERSLTDQLKAEALRLGFAKVGVAPAVDPPGYPRFREWLKQGHAAGMDYLVRQADARAHPNHLLEGVRSVVMATMLHGSATPISTDPRRGRIARYAQGPDYHEVLWRRLEALLAWLRMKRPEANGRAVADTAPLLERDFASCVQLHFLCLLLSSVGQARLLVLHLGPFLCATRRRAQAPSPLSPPREYHPRCYPRYRCPGPPV